MATPRSSRARRWSRSRCCRRCLRVGATGGDSPVLLTEFFDSARQARRLVDGLRGGRLGVRRDLDGNVGFLHLAELGQSCEVVGAALLRLGVLRLDVREVLRLEALVAERRAKAAQQITEV